MLAGTVIASAGLAIVEPRSARAGAADGFKAVVIVGPASFSTAEYLDAGERIARQAEDQGMDVRRVFTPRATWRRVKQNLQDANLVVYLGHGNGWPSPYGPFRAESKNGFGLNPCEDDCGTSGPTRYYGEAFIREEIRLAPKSVVLLHRLCYASGNVEDHMAPVFDRRLATARVSNFASGFLDAGAGVVFALGWRQRINLPAALARSDKTMDEIFMTPGTPGDYYDGFQGWDDYYRDSTRNEGARVHLDPHRRHGHMRAITGQLRMTANEWRGQAPPPDEVAPRLEVRRAGTVDAPAAAGADGTVVFSPDGDGLADLVVIQRSLSEPAFVDVEVRNQKGATVRLGSRFAEMGAGQTYWDGRNDAGGMVGDGAFQVRLTPRDRAGNVGEPRVVDVRVLTSLRRLVASRAAINPGDGDSLASSVVLRSRLRRGATVTWQIRRDGAAVRSRFTAEALGPGDLAWTWDGTDDTGAPMQRGWYQAVISATTDDGTLRYRVPILVGNWRWGVSDRTPGRGQRLTVSVLSTEPLSGAPTLEVAQPGRPPRQVMMELVGPRRATATFRLSSSGTRGRMRLTVVGTDARGQEETGTMSLPVH